MSTNDNTSMLQTRTYGEVVEANEKAPPTLVEGPNGERWILQGQFSMLAGKGGSGKTRAALQLAACMATGREWFGKFHAVEGSTLYISGESASWEIREVLDAIVDYMNLAASERKTVEEQIHIADASTQPPSLLKSGNKHNGEVVSEWRQTIEAIAPKLVVVDPMVSFAGADAETDNAAAQAFVNVLRGLARLPSQPAVLVVHHSRKGKGSGADMVRGSSALVNGARWVGFLDGESIETVKANYGARGEEYELVFTDKGVLTSTDQPTESPTSTSADDNEFEYL